MKAKNKLLLAMAKAVLQVHARLTETVRSEAEVKAQQNLRRAIDEIEQANEWGPDF